MTALHAALVLAVVFFLLSAVHVYWAAGGSWGFRAAVPVVDGNAAFSPTPIATLAVAVALWVAAGLVLWCAEWIDFRVAAWAAPVPVFGTWVIAIVFALRAVGDFRHVGFFKKSDGSRFARLDTRVYSPLCAAIAALASWVANAR